MEQKGERREMEQKGETEIDRDLEEGRFADWIKPDIIAEIIFDELEDCSIDLTEENAKLVYLDVLENALYEAVRSAVKHIPELRRKENA